MKINYLKHKIKFKITNFIFKINLIEIIILYKFKLYINK